MSITRSITRPIVRGITRGIVRGGFDADAAAYIAAVETALSSSISGDQKNAINDFFKTGKSDGWYSSIKRLYLPIWADAAANAIDMVTRTSGTFAASGVTHASGYVQGDGVSGYFNTNFNPTTTSMTKANAWQGYLQYSAKVTVNQFFIGSGNNEFGFRRFAASDTIQASPGAINWSSQNGQGIMSARLGATGNNQMFRRYSGGRSEVANAATLPGDSLPSLSIFAMATNDAGTAVGFSTSQHGAWWWGEDAGDTADAAFTLALKDLWETASGLTLP